MSEEISEKKKENIIHHEKLEKYLNENNFWMNPSKEELKEISYKHEYKKDFLKCKINSYKEPIPIFYRHYEQKFPRGVVFLFHDLANCSDTLGISFSLQRLHCKRIQEDSF
jgi:hypothetical protein